jgi:CspA family cold shock protein
MAAPVKRQVDSGEETNMPTGNVKWFDPKKGFGFIIGEGGQDVFVHYTTIVGEGFRCLKDDDIVDYELVQGPKGLLARNVRRLTDSTTKPIDVQPPSEWQVPPPS